MTVYCAPSSVMAEPMIRGRRQTGARNNHPKAPPRGYCPGRASCGAKVRPSSAHYAQHSEEIGRDQARIQMFRFVATGKIELAALQHRHIDKRVALLFPAEIVPELDRSAFRQKLAQRWMAFPKHCDPLRIAIRHFAQQDRIDHTEDGGICAHTQSQGDDSD